MAGYPRTRRTPLLLNSGFLVGLCMLLTSMEPATPLNQPRDTTNLTKDVAAKILPELERLGFHTKSPVKFKTTTVGGFYYKHAEHLINVGAIPVMNWDDDSGWTDTGRKVDRNESTAFITLYLRRTRTMQNYELPAETETRGTLPRSWLESNQYGQMVKKWEPVAYNTRFSLTKKTYHGIPAEMKKTTQRGQVIKPTASLQSDLSSTTLDDAVNIDQATHINAQFLYEIENETPFFVRLDASSQSPLMPAIDEATVDHILELIARTLLEELGESVPGAAEPEPDIPETPTEAEEEDDDGEEESEDEESTESETTDITVDGKLGDVIRVDLGKAAGCSTDPADQPRFEVVMPFRGGMGRELALESDYRIAVAEGKVHDKNTMADQDNWYQDSRTFRACGIFYFIPHIKPYSKTQEMATTVEADFICKNKIIDDEGNRIPREVKGKLKIRITNDFTRIPPGGDPDAHPGAVTFGSGVLDLLRKQQRLRYLGFHGHDDKPVEVSGKIRPADAPTVGVIQVPEETTWAIGLFNLAVEPVKNAAINSNGDLHSIEFSVHGKRHINGPEAPSWKELKTNRSHGYWLTPQIGVESWATDWTEKVLGKSGENWKNKRAAFVRGSSDTAIQERHKYRTEGSVPLLAVTAGSQKKGGVAYNSRGMRLHMEHSGGMDLDFEVWATFEDMHATPNPADAFPKQPFYETVAIAGVPYPCVAAPGGRVIARAQGDATRFVIAKTDAPQIATRAVRSSEAWRAPDLLWKIQSALVSPPRYDPVLIKRQIEAVLEVDGASGGPFADSVYYNDPRTWDLDGKVQFSKIHGGHFHVNVLPPGASPSRKVARTRPPSLTVE